MILTVNYNKSTGEITLSSDIDEILSEVNTGSVEDDSSNLFFEVAIDTTQYEDVNSYTEEEIITEE